MSIIYEVVSKSVRKAADGSEKTQWTKIGVVMSTKSGGMAMKLESVPVGWDGWASLFEPKPKEDRAPKSIDKMDDDIPW